jgi:hypothetical protein
MIFEMTEFQARVITDAINNQKVVLVTLHPSIVDSPEKQSKFANDVYEMYLLVKEGLLKDISDKFVEEIQLSKFNNNRTYSVFTFTDLGLKLFATHDKRKVN